MSDKIRDPIVDLNDSVELLLKQVDDAEAKLVRLEDLATVLRSQASTLDGKLAQTDKLVDEYKQIIEDSAELLRSSTSAMEQSKDAAVAEIRQAIECAMESHRLLITESQASFRQEFAKLIEKTRTRFAEDVEKFRDSENRVSGDVEALLTETAKAFESQIRALRAQMNEFAQVEAGKVRAELDAAFQLWEARNLPDTTVEAVTTAATSALWELKAEILSELRRPWWKRRSHE